MRVETSSQVLGWENNTRITETRNTYQYDKGNDVTTVERRSETFSGYDVNGKSDVQTDKGSNVDKQV